MITMVGNTLYMFQMIVCKPPLNYRDCGEFKEGLDHNALLYRVKGAYLENAISINPKNDTYCYMICSLPPEPLFMNFGGGSFFKMYSGLGP